MVMNIEILMNIMVIKPNHKFLKKENTSWN